MYPCFITTTDDAHLAYPHYSDPKWASPLTIYGEYDEVVFANYDDRLRTDRAAHTRAHEAAGAQQNTAGWWKRYLAAWHERPITLRYILAGSDLGSGYPYYILGYTVGPAVPTVGSGMSAAPT